MSVLDSKDPKGPLTANNYLLLKPDSGKSEQNLTCFLHNDCNPPNFPPFYCRFAVTFLKTNP